MHKSGCSKRGGRVVKGGPEDARYRKLLDAATGRRPHEAKSSAVVASPTKVRPTAASSRSRLAILSAPSTANYPPKPITTIPSTMSRTAFPLPEDDADACSVVSISATSPIAEGRRSSRQVSATNST